MHLYEEKNYDCKDFLTTLTYSQCFTAKHIILIYSGVCPHWKGVSGTTKKSCKKHVFYDQAHYICNVNRVSKSPKVKENGIFSKLLSYAFRVLNIQLTYLGFNTGALDLSKFHAYKLEININILPDKEPHARRAKCYYLLRVSNGPENGYYLPRALPKMIRPTYLG